MKKFLVILFFFFTGYQAIAQSYYDVQWKKVETLLDKKKSKDAEALIKSIMAKAKEEGNTEQRIKSLILLRKAVAERDEENNVNTIRYFEREIKGLKFPEKNIIHSMVASLYNKYYQRNRWKIYKRTEVSNSNDLKYPEDITTWTPQLFFNKIQEQYDASLQNISGLQKFPLKAFPELIIEGVNTSDLHPTLFDVLIHRAIDYYKNNEIDITKAAYYFKLKSNKAFAPAAEFANHVFQTKDDYSTKHIALSYFQLATRYHLNDQKPNALIDLEAKRLEFVWSRYDGNKKEEKYRAALKKLVDTYPSNRSTAYPMLLLSKSYQDEEKSEALKWAKRIQEKFPNSFEVTHAKRVEQQIKMKSLSLTTEKADIPGKNILGKLSFRNLDKVFFKIIPLTYQQFKERETDYRKNKVPPVATSIRDWNITLHHPEWTAKKYDGHETEFLIKALPKGHYAIVASGSAAFDSKKAPISYTLFQSTPVSYVVGGIENGHSLYVLHRETGKPLRRAKVTRYTKNYDYKLSKYVTKTVDEKYTNSDGLISYESPKTTYETYSLEIAHKDEHLWIANAFNTNRSLKAQDREKLFLFSDRAIYRPGQNIYFKGILINSQGDRRKHQTVGNKEIEVILRDANYKEVKKQSFTTNDFGSIHGSFTAPEGLLNGRFTLTTSYGSHSVRVEEYKRPKFEVTMDSLTQNVRLGDQVRVTGQAKAYAGNSVEGAKVKYIVKRNVRWPYYWCFSYWGAPTVSNEVVITQGETVTDEDGKFELSFTAFGDESIDTRTKPFYNFEVHADVTDVNGEVRSGNMQYPISRESLIIKLDMDKQIDFNYFNSVTVKTTNLQGQFTPADVKLEFIRLQAPERFLKERMWSTPKENMLTKADFTTYFPDYEYKNESDPLFWEEDETIWVKNERTDEGGKIFLQKIAPVEGYYLMRATARDQNNILIEEKKVIRMVNRSKKEAQPNEALFTHLTEEELEPGDKTVLSVASTFNDAHIHKTIMRSGIFSSSWGQKTEQFTIQETDRGNFGVNYFMIRNNRLYQQNVSINVPWSNKDLKITYETFRNKILPGSQQEWKIKISGPQKEKVSAELLTSMYDASLDAFAKNNWHHLKLYGNNNTHMSWSTRSFGIGTHRTLYKRPPYIKSSVYKNYPSLNTYGLIYAYNYGWNQNRSLGSSRVKRVELSEETNAAMASPRAGELLAADTVYVEDPVGGELRMTILNHVVDENQQDQMNDVKIRTNMSETAFFFPELKTDEEGNVVFSFTAPDALTRWNVKALAHTKDLQSGYLEKTLVTQKELMLTPNHPRFMRENDKMVYSSKLTNLSEKDISGTAQLDIINAITNKSINDLFDNRSNQLSFDLNAGKSKELVWNLNIPQAFTDPVIVRILAKGDGYSDGEQKSIPLLLNSMLVTETLPLPVRANSTKNFHFDKLINSHQSSTLRHHKLTIEYTANPAWYAVQALPYLTDYPYECSEQTFNRYYANALASHIANSSPKIQKVFSEWEDKDTAALLSNLEKNQELKSALLQETPWVFEAENETAQKKLIAQLFNMNRMSKALKSTLNKLQKLQTPNGGFAWFKGMRDNRYITQYIVTGIARLQKLGVVDAQTNDQLLSILNKALPYLDANMVEDYQYLKRKKLLENRNLSYYQIQYLYMRSFFLDRKMKDETRTAFEYYKGKGKKHWMDYGKYMQGMLALAMNRYNEKSTAQDIMEGLRQNAIHKEEMGMYWKEFSQGSYWWHQAPIEAHSLLIEAFNEMPQKRKSNQDLDEVDELRIWLLKQKQTQQWKTTKATADACYALLLGGTDWLGAEPTITMKFGKENINLKDLKQEAGTGYTKFSFKQNEINSNMGNIQVSVKSSQDVGTTWGAAYWQYFEQLDKITKSETPLSLKKQVYKIKQGDRGEELVLVKKNEQLQVGDKVKIRIELRVDRKMEFVHMKDMRGACFEPINVLSQYKYQNGLGYYESTKDASTQFFFDYLSPGTYVFEYPMFATMRGDYSNGITTIQCMYAPEFSSHSEGIRVNVK